MDFPKEKAVQTLELLSREKYIDIDSLAVILQSSLQDTVDLVGYLLKTNQVLVRQNYVIRR